jgi:hypothetical protein
LARSAPSARGRLKLDRCGELLGVDLAGLREAADVEPYMRADGARIWSVMQLERQLRPESYRRGGCLDRRRIPAADAEHRNELVKAHARS